MKIWVRRATSAMAGTRRCCWSGWRSAMNLSVRWIWSGFTHFTWIVSVASLAWTCAREARVSAERSRARKARMGVSYRLRLARNPCAVKGLGRKSRTLPRAASSFGLRLAGLLGSAIRRRAFRRRPSLARCWPAGEHGACLWGDAAGLDSKVSRLAALRRRRGCGLPPLVLNANSPTPLTTVRRRRRDAAFRHRDAGTRGSVWSVGCSWCRHSGERSESRIQEGPRSDKSTDGTAPSTPSFRAILAKGS